MPSPAPHRRPYFVSGDLDGFFALSLDNLVQFLVILGLCRFAVGLPSELIMSSVLPGAALSILAGNLYYAREARRLGERTGRDDCTALPYGINTPSVFAFVFLVMLPVKQAALAEGASEVVAAHTAYQVGLGACLLSAVIELLGAPFADVIRRHTPRAALLSALAGIAISFIAMDFAMRMFETPLISLLPFTVILAAYFGRARMPLHLPGGTWALLLGTAAAWLLSVLPGEASPVSTAALGQAFESVGPRVPVPLLADLWHGLRHPLTARYFVPVILPMGLMNVLGSLQNLESAEAAGDAYPSAPCLAVNGLGSAVAAVFGSCFPTTIYIGHPGWKALGARSGYSILNGLFFTLVALLGLSSALAALIPLEAGMAIVVWIGLIITAQAFQTTPSAHAPAVALGLFPALAGWGVMVLSQSVSASGLAAGDPGLAGRTLADAAHFLGAGLHLSGLFALSQGFLLSSLVWSAAATQLIERRFNAAARWLLVGALLAFFGFIHVGELSAAGATYDVGFGSGARFALAYALCAATSFAIGLENRP